MTVRWSVHDRRDKRSNEEENAMHNVHVHQHAVDTSPWWSGPITPPRWEPVRAQATSGVGAAGWQKVSKVQHSMNLQLGCDLQGPRPLTGNWTRFHTNWLIFSLHYYSNLLDIIHTVTFDPRPHKLRLLTCRIPQSWQSPLQLKHPSSIYIPLYPVAQYSPAW